ncbi:hypothetical protein RZS08_10345, partial [Arthrospira platensis SPKY1]|nr:hypothetical protein [Arthrospira platensis SPKY1]
LNELHALGVHTVSISGAKGKRLLGEKWEQPIQRHLRGWRSCVESSVFVLKHSYRFGKLGRRGLDAVRRELTEKAIAYNFDRILHLRHHAKQDPAAPAIAMESQHPPPQARVA